LAADGWKIIIGLLYIERTRQSRRAVSRSIPENGIPQND
jgi:hypothetical protein